MESINDRIKVMIAGIGGASLGTEILKCLLLADKYVVYGCDISNLAYGHYQACFEKTFIVSREYYVDDIIRICRRERIYYIIPGAEEPMVLLNEARSELERDSIVLVGNSSDIIKTFSNKEAVFVQLRELGFCVPHTITVQQEGELGNASFPAIVKPSLESGGSSFVFLVQNMEEAKVYTNFLLVNGKRPIIQEYIPEHEGEFTVGVLSLPDSALVGSIALKRSFSNKLSIAAKMKEGIISSGYSQGLIDSFPDVKQVSEKIATAIGSKGPINVQGRVKNGVFMPFEINPRFSASTYLRAIAGFNEIDIFLCAITGREYCRPDKIQYGYYLRSFTEVFVNKDMVKNDSLDY